MRIPILRSPGLLLSALFAPCLMAEEAVSLGEYSAAVRTRVAGKIREALGADGRTAEVIGTVTFAGKGVVFLQKGGEGLKVLVRDNPPAVGDEVAVTGSPSLEGGRIVFVAEKWSRIGHGDVPTPREASRDDLVDDAAIGESVHGLLVSVEGRAIGTIDGGFALRVDDVPVNVMVSRLPAFLEGCEQTHPRVRVIGVAELMLDQSSLLDRAGYVMGVKIDVARPEDVALDVDLQYLSASRDRRFTAVVAALIVLLASGLLAFAIVIFRQRRGLFRTRTIMAERRRMADDIHDTIEQHLVGAGMLLKINRIKEAEEVLVRAKREIRDIVWGLKNDDMMRLSPAEMIRKLAHEENIKGLYRVDTRLEGLPERLDAAQMRDLSLIVRETIGNAVKHGGAKHIAVSSDPLEGGGWVLRISNDGTPFDPDSAPGASAGHFGIEGMKQRARRLGATVSFEPRGKGMVMILTKNMV